MKDHKLDGAPRCPKCNKLLDGAMGMHNDDPPEAGDLTVCYDCESFLQFLRSDHRLQLFAVDERKLDPDMRMELEAARELVRTVKLALVKP